MPPLDEVTLTIKKRLCELLDYEKRILPSVHDSRYQLQNDCIDPFVSWNKDFLFRGTVNSQFQSVPVQI